MQYTNCRALSTFTGFALFALAASTSIAADVKVWQKHVDNAELAIKARDGKEADRWYHAALQEALGFKSKDIPKLIDTHQMVAFFKFRISQPEVAMTHLAESIKVARQHYREKDPKLGFVLLNAGHQAGMRHRFELAEEWMMEGLKMISLRTGAFSPEVGQLRLIIGHVCLENKKYDLAEEHFKKSLDIFGTSTSYTTSNQGTFINTPEMTREHKGANFTGAAASRHGLAMTYKGQGKTAETIEQFDELVKAAEKQRNGEELLIEALVEYASYHTEQKAWDKAETHLQRALAVAGKKFGPDDGRNYVPLLQLTTLYSILGKVDQADELADRMLLAKEKAGEKEDLSKAWTELGDTRMKTDKLPGAERAYVKALALDEKAGGPINLTHIPLLGKLIALYEKTGEDAKLEVMLGKQIAIAADTFGPQSKALLVYLDKQAAAVRRQNRASAADAIEARAKAIRAANP